MAYTNNWDETDPDGAVVAASDIDREIRQVKVDVRERLEQVIPGFGDDSVDPKVMGEGTARLTVDTSGNRPSTPSLEGEAFFESDNDNLYVAEPDGSGGLQWAIVSLDPTVQLAQISEYDDSQAAGSKETTSSEFNDVLLLHVSGTTDSNGLITVDTAELSGSWDPGLIWADQVIAVPDAASVSNVANAVYKNPGSSTFDLEFRNYNGGLVTSAAVSCTVFLPQL